VVLPNDFLQSLVKRIQGIAATRSVIPHDGVHSDFSQVFLREVSAAGSCDIEGLLLLVEGSLACACARHGIDGGERRRYFAAIVEGLFAKVDAATRGAVESVLSSHDFMARREAYVRPHLVAG
jgi:hypothetical protein